MTEKRYFNIIPNGIQDIETGKIIHGSKIGDLMNEQEEKIQQLKREKERYKRLSEIRDEHINNRILSLKEFINNCEDEKVKTILEDFFYSEVKEYNLAKENRKLKRYNKSQELEIVRLHKLADAMSGVLKEFGVYDVYNKEQVDSVKEKLK